MPAGRGLILVADGETEFLSVLCEIIRGWGYETIGVPGAEEAISMLGDRNFDLLLADLVMPDMDGIQLISKAFAINPDLTAIIMNGDENIQTAVAAIKGGAFDYLLKPLDCKILRSTLSRALEAHRQYENKKNRRVRNIRDAAGIPLSIEGMASDITDRKRMEQALRESEAKYRELVENANSIIMRRDTRGRITFFNEFAQKFFGYSEQEITGRHIVGSIVPETDSSGKDLRKMITDITRNPEEYETNENENMLADGSRVWIAWTNKAILDGEGNVREILCIGNDITRMKRAEEAFRESLQERKALETQLMQAQKMEAVGTLAGGIAHDFNNILTAIITYSNIALMKMDKDIPVANYIGKIVNSAEKAAALVQSLLAFSRKKIMTPEIVDLDSTIMRIEHFLRKLIGEDVELKLELGEQPLTVMADSGQIEHVLMNLATNARDAIPDIGSLVIATGIFTMDGNFIKTHGYGKAGRYAMITVTDTGEGMEEKTRERIFEPFFTTKEVGKGTGLGLAMVYGIIKQHEGYISCYSEPGKGSTFRIYLPLIESKTRDVPESAVPSIPTGTETILLAEDNTDVRMAAREILTDGGYRVIEAVDGEDAVLKFTKSAEEISLLILDVIMPRKNGKEVYDTIRQMRPDIKVLFSSGYPADIINKKGILEQRMHFILKPFSTHVFLQKVRDVLDEDDSRD